MHEINSKTDNKNLRRETCITMKKVFDTHIHSTQKVSVEKSVEVFKKIFEWTGVEKALFLGLPQDSKGHTDFSQNVKTLFYKQYFDGYGFYGLSHDMSLTDGETEKDFLRQAQEAWEGGFDGVKMLDGKPSMRRIYKRLLSDPVYDKFYSFMEECGLPITLHNADPATFWDITKLSPYALEHGWYCGDGLSKDELFEDVMQVMQKHPKLHLTLAHLGFTGDNIEQAERFLGGYEHTMFDTTPNSESYFDMLQDWETWHTFFKRYSDRIKYGADTYNFEAKDEEELKVLSTRRPYFQRRFFETADKHIFGGTEFYGVKLDEELIEKIYIRNAEREYGVPRKINAEYVGKLLKKLRKYYEQDVFIQNDLSFIKNKI